MVDAPTFDDCFRAEYASVVRATDRATVVRELLGTDPLLVGSVWPSIEVVASTGWTQASPIVVVRIGEGAAARSYAFVVGWEEVGPMRIQRLPVPGDDLAELGPSQGSEVVGGRTIVLPAAPVEGGVRVYVDGTEVGGSFDLDSRTVRITVPEGDPGPITVTVTTATPELPGAVAWTFLRR